MKLMTLAAAASAAALSIGFAASAHAQDGAVTYTGEIGVSHTRTTDSGEDIGLNAVQLRGGAQFHKNFGVEIEGAIGVGEDEVRVLGTNVSVKQNWQVGAYAVGYLPVSESTDLLARLGYVNSEVEADVLGVTSADTFDGVAAGVGVRFFPQAGKNGVRADYTRYFLDGEDANVFSVSYVRKF